MRPYLTVLKAAQAEQTIERSRFIGHVCPAKTVAECEAFFECIRKEHRQATHNVPAYVLGEGCRLQWAGDDGEPRGTSGAPVAHMLAGEGISDVCIMVTRYFGGIKLGTGGLVRAYTGTAKLALAAAGLGKVSEKLVLSFEMDYAGYHRLEATADAAFAIESAEFAGAVTAAVACGPGQRDKAQRQVLAAVPRARLISEWTGPTTTPLAWEGTILPPRR
ncbi:MAG: YigZ family protein [Clostridiales Family XIII bacterium]|jgi:uncharacterized YigZ family protein|nr:YigZ family protein [Clostridiales Family XIII bacterium]